MPRMGSSSYDAVMKITIGRDPTREPKGFVASVYGRQVSFWSKYEVANAQIRKTESPPAVANSGESE